MKKKKRPKQFLDRGWPLGLTRIDKKREKSHNKIPKKFQHKKKVIGAEVLHPALKVAPMSGWTVKKDARFHELFVAPPGRRMSDIVGEEE